MSTTRKRTKVTAKSDDAKKEKDGSTSTEQASANGTSTAPRTRTYWRIVVRVGLAFVIMFLARIFIQYPLSGGPPEKKLVPFVTFMTATERTAMDVPCSKDYDEERKQHRFKECVPKRCGRVVMDKVVSDEDARHLLRLAKAGLALGGSSGGASILDLHSGALSKGDKFIDIYRYMESSGNEIFTEKDMIKYRHVKEKIHNAITTEFNISHDKLYLTKPTFFSRMDTKPAKTIHDEYWHPHVDKITYGSFHYTSLLYLSDYEIEFTGGRFTFVDKDVNRTVEPKLGRLSFFTSGSENVHFVEKVQSGTRYAITVSFTCDPAKSIDDPTIRY